MFKYLPFLLTLLPFHASAAPVWVGPDCRITWDANPPDEFVQGYKVHIRNRGATPSFIVDSDVGDVTQTTCGAFSIPQGRYEIWLTAYNPARESGPGNVVPFVLLTAAPEDLDVSAPTNTTVESAGGT